MNFNSKLKYLNEKINLVEEYINEGNFNGGGKGYNPYRAKDGKFTFGPGGIKAYFKDRIDGKEIRESDDGNLVINEVEITPDLIKEVMSRVNDSIHNGNPDDLLTAVMEENGWLQDGDGWVLNKKLTNYKGKLQDGEIQVFNNGKEYLEDTNGEFYKSFPSTNEDGTFDPAGLYMLDDYEMEFNSYADGKKEKIISLAINPKKYVSISNLDTLRKIVGDKIDLFKDKSYFPDSVVLNMFGFDGYKRKTTEGPTEYFVINIDGVSIYWANGQGRSTINNINGINKNMRKISKAEYEGIKNKLSLLEEVLNGGAGSGNFGHSGRPGKVGGSRTGGGVKGLAQKSLEQAKKEEPEVSKDLKDVFNENNAEFGGFDFRLKGAGSLERKIKQDQKDSGSPRTMESLKKAAEGIKDNLRYTALLDKDNYGSGFENIKKQLESKGYEFTKVKNLMAFPEEGNPYRGVNAQVKNKNGYMFELQFHTPQSFGLKEAIHKDYEIARNPVKYSQEQRDAATARMFKSYESLEVPKDADRIKPFKK